MIGKPAPDVKAVVSLYLMTSLLKITAQANAHRVRERVGLLYVEFLNTCDEVPIDSACGT